MGEVGPDQIFGQAVRGTPARLNIFGESAAGVQDLLPAPVLEREAERQPRVVRADLDRPPQFRQEIRGRLFRVPDREEPDVSIHDGLARSHEVFSDNLHQKADLLRRALPVFGKANTVSHRTPNLQQHSAMWIRASAPRMWPAAEAVPAASPTFRFRP